MIKANELRIGNWVIEGHDLRQVDISNDDLWHIGNFDPIPLSPEILTACGFSLVKYKYPDRERFELEFISIHKDHEWWYSIDSCEYEQNSGSSNRVVKYLHQLQNIYFIISGEELKYNH